MVISQPCPHCGALGVFSPQAGAAEHNLSVTIYFCVSPSCQKPWIGLHRYINDQREKEPIVIWPRESRIEPPPPEVPIQIAEDYREAATVINYSPKASAALSRRCLQSVLRDKGYMEHDLWQQISNAKSALPRYIAEAIDAIRHYGNFAAHPTKEKVTGEIIDVEPGEAEWLLTVLLQLFDFYYVQPERLAQQKQALNAKLQAAGKPPMP